MSAVLQNALALMSRRPKLTVALVLALLIISISISAPGESIRARTQDIIQTNLLSIPYTFRGQAVLEDAHLLKDADDFLPHFKAVIEYPSMPILEAKSSCGWPNEEDVNFQFNHDASRPDATAWVIKDEDDLQIEMRRKEWQYFVGNEMRPWAPYKKRFSGRGIVVTAGHHQSVQRVKVMLRALDKLGSKLPVEVSYWGENELKDGTMQQLLDVRPDLLFNDLSATGQPLPTFFTGLMNFHLKIAAIVNSRFAEVVMMDADNIPVIDPAELFDSETYKEFGTIFWPDIARTRPQNPIWPVTNTRCSMDEWEQESGQLVVDKRKFWYHLQLASWFVTEHVSYYRELILGDKDLFRFAWHALRTRYGTPSRWVTSVGTLSPGKTPADRQLFCGHSFAQHHPDKDGKVAFLHGGLLKTMYPQVISWHLEHQGGIFQAYKRDRSDQDKHATPRVTIMGDQAYFLAEQDKSSDYMPAWCTEMPNSGPEPLEDLLPGFQETYKEIGGYWMLDPKNMQQHS